MNCIGIIGAGNIGSSLAHNMLLYNKKIVLVDISDEILEQSKEKIKKDLRFTNLYVKSKDKLNTKELLNNITFTTDLNELKNVDFVVENVTEDWNIKKEIYKKIDKICPPDVCFGVNTSCISITKVAAITNRSDKVIGCHFMNPVYLKEYVEVIKGYYTSEETINTINSFFDEIQKKAIIINDFPGFVSNRISHLFMNEAIFTVQDGTATPEQVDMVFKKCFNHKMGPLETADLIGLDTVYKSLLVLYESYRDSKYRPAPLLEKMVYAGLLGVKTGKGFYNY